MKTTRVTALAGGTGAAKFLRGLTRCLDAPDLTIIGNTGDDVEVWGLHISPDLDTVTYALAGLLDVERGWGLKEESFRALGGMAALGEPTWFQLGDRDLAIHLYRTRALRDGHGLTAVTASIGRALGVKARVLPMTEAPVRTRVRTPDGWLDFQEYFVRDKARAAVVAVEYAGAEAARPGPAVLEAIDSGAAVIVCPSNPVTSIGPILAVPGIRAALERTRAPVVAVSPIVGAAAVSGPAGELMRARGLPISATGVAKAYAPWLRTLVLDRADADQAPSIRGLGVTPVVADTIMRDRAGEVALARAVLETIQ